MKRIKHIAKPLCTLALLGTLPLASAAGITAKPSTHQLYVNGVRANAAAWLINGNNYFKLRDLGRLADFGVTYDSKTNAVKIETDKGYIPEPNETIIAPSTGTTKETANPTSQTVYVDGRQVTPEVYTINGNNYFKLRDLGELVNFKVAYDSATQSVNLTTDTRQNLKEPSSATTQPETAKVTWDRIMSDFNNDMIACNWDKTKYLETANKYRVPITGKPDGTVQEVIAALNNMQGAPVDAVSMDNNPVNLYWANELRKALGKSIQHTPINQPEKVTDEMLREWENGMIKLINEERRKAEVPEVTQDKTLTDFARYWADHVTKDFRHSTISDMREYADRIGIDVNTLEGGENITGAYQLDQGYDPMAEAMKNFMNSHGHKAAILRKDITRAGVGFAVSDKGDIYCCQNFGK